MSDEVVEEIEADPADDDSRRWHVGVRKILRPGDDAWMSYYYNHPFSQVEQLRTVDTYFNEVIDGTYLIASLDELLDILEMLPAPGDNQYYQLYTDALTHEPPAPQHRLTLLGYDLSDWTSVSTLTNCGKWQDDLEPLASCVNKYGLLDLESAQRAQILLPQLRVGDPHAQVTIWAVYERL